ncbi:MAG: zinc ribbon domain-containing protein [Candidatus Synoicihabitans palmerolidicus]|nr:zinc ribbon domain-containing protein [Candidatus Synoicihabitans palmerolidicus]
MPTYDYHCTKCNHEFEAFHSMKDAPIKTCPKCKKRSVKRHVGGGAGLIFKGSGFYITDYKNKPVGTAEKGAATDKKPAKTESKASD